MPYTNDLQSEADIISPAYAAQQQGIRNDLANQQQQIANTTAQGRQAAEIQQPGLQNLFMQAQTNNQQALGQQEQARANLATATLPSSIEATNTANETKMTADRAQQLNTLGQYAGVIAGQMDNVDPQNRPAAMQQIASYYKIPIDSLGPLANGDPDQMRAFAHKAVGMSAAYQTEMAKVQQQGLNELGVANANAQGRMATTQELVGGRRDVANIQAQAKKDMAPPQALAGALLRKVAEGTATPEETKMADYLQKTFQLDKQGNAFGAAITGTNVAANLPTMPTVGNQNTAAAAPAANNLIVAAKSVWPNDDPTKYDYRVDPSGNLQRRPK